MKTRTLIATIATIFATHGISAQEIDTLSSSQVQKLIAEQTDLRIIDARTPAEYAEGHIKGAINIDVNNQSVDNLLRNYINDSNILLYCRTNRRSGIEVQKLIQMGYKGHIYYMSDGITGWTSNRFPLDK